MRAEDLRALAGMSHTLREGGCASVADGIDIEISAELERDAIARLEQECERDLLEHHRRLRAEHGDPFGGET